MRRFAYRALDGSLIRSSDLHGRMTLILFVTTYDVASQAQARIAQHVLRRHTPRINVLLVVLEAPHHKPLIQAFAQSLGLRYPVVFGDANTIAGRGAFSGLRHVPSVVVLDRSGRERWRHVGLIRQPALRDAIERHDDRSR
jgi:hypothetical protein